MSTNLVLLLKATLSTEQYSDSTIDINLWNWIVVVRLVIIQKITSIMKIMAPLFLLSFPIFQQKYLFSWKNVPISEY